MSANPPQSSNGDEPITQLTLRDYFATAALQGELSGMSDKEKRALHELGRLGVNLSNLAADSSYLYADAMLAARRKSHQEILSPKSYETIAETSFWQAFKKVAGLAKK